MFVVYADHPVEQSQLQEDHPNINQHFYVSFKETKHLTGMIQSILFEYFRGIVPLLAKKISQFVLDILNMTLSFNLFREILELIKVEGSTLHAYNSYFSQINLIVDHQSRNTKVFDENQEEEYELFTISKARCSKMVEEDQFQQTLDKEINIRNIDKSKRSKFTRTKDQLETLLQSLNTKQKLQNLTQKVRIYHSEDKYWWKEQNLNEHINKNNQSQSLLQFDRRGEHLIHQQDSINELVRRQVQFDFQIESEYFIRDVNKKTINRELFNKKMKNRLIGAKLRKRKRKR